MNVLLRRTDLFSPLQLEFDRFFDEFFKDRRTFVAHLKNSSNFPKMDAITEGDLFIVRMAVSGMTKEDVDIVVTPDGLVTVEGRISKEYIPAEEADVHVKELRTSAFQRCFRLPQEVVYEGFSPKAKLQDGILTLTWSLNVAEEPEPQKIEIE